MLPLFMFSSPEQPPSALTVLSDHMREEEENITSGPVLFGINPCICSLETLQPVQFNLLSSETLDPAHTQVDHLDAPVHDGERVLFRVS